MGPARTFVAAAVASWAAVGLVRALRTASTAPAPRDDDHPDRSPVSGAAVTREKVDTSLEHYDRQARRYRAAFLASRTVSLLLGGAVAVLGLLPDPLGLDANDAKSLIGSFGVLLTLIEGVSGLTQLHSRWLSYRSGWWELERLRDSYDAQLVPFDRTGREKELTIAYLAVRDTEFRSWYASAVTSGSARPATPTAAEGAAG